MFYDKLLQICNERGLKITNVVNELGMSSGNISKWKNGVEPRGSVISKFADYFGVEGYYFSENRKEANHGKRDNALSEDEWTLIDAFRAADSKGRFRIIQVCMNELDAAEARLVQQDGQVSS